MADAVATIVADLSSTVPTHLLPPVATPKQVAELLSTTTDRLAQDRYLRRGIPYVKHGKSVRYLRDHVLKFLADNMIGGVA